MPLPKRRRTITPQERKARETEARREPIKLLAKMSTLEIENNTLKRKLAGVELVYQQKTNQVRDELERELETARGLLISRKAGELQDAVEDAAKKIVMEYMEPMVRDWDTLAARHSRTLEELAAVNAICQKFVDTDEAHAREVETLKREKAEIVGGQLELQLALRNAYETGVAPRWMMRMAAQVVGAPKGKLADEAAKEFLKRCLTFCRDQAATGAKQKPAVVTPPAAEPVADHSLACAHDQALPEMPACGHRNMKDPLECDNTETQAEDGGLAKCPSLKPEIIDGVEHPAPGCAHYQMLVEKKIAERRYVIVDGSRDAGVYTIDEVLGDEEHGDEGEQEFTANDNARLRALSPGDHARFESGEIEYDIYCYANEAEAQAAVEENKAAWIADEKQVAP